MSKYNLSAPFPTPCTPHPALAPYVDQLDHWHKTEILLLQKMHDLLRTRILPALSLPFFPSVPAARQDPPLPQTPSAPPQADPPTPPPPLPPSAPSNGISPPCPDAATNLCSAVFASLRSMWPSPSLTALLPLLTFPMLLTPLPLKPILEYEKLLLKQAQLVLTCQKLQTKASRPAQPRATAPQDDPQDYSKAIALMRKEYFANVDEYERSGLLKIPPLPDPRGAGILPAPPGPQTGPDRGGSTDFVTGLGSAENACVGQGPLVETPR